ncbi:AP-2 adaptor complex subunit Apm4 [Schizosaccharomyces cryophilus OY26]|uniref:AP-2 adaptor complex subunit Apm4 n=1 Tax=Schizosaccharomyces cryophilus (strain OY26 / ATCC MYA-4695 / CBS 11777 / NBRC 106824 / NRRL Y48691) TaxID=653667 RepID=S9W6K7_SCHCR|nr:AP-2 adaptor complex subunit Apm4 [Schizosaccharomyces cryophilus OY26]EPY53470.1 AP-2 adaptor complex subunit Apm4 [Schizosaccharomyces cryophilus OY26]
MISGVFFFNLKGDNLICRTFRHDLKSSITDVIRVHVLSNPELRTPIATFGSTSYTYVRNEDLYIVTVAKGNPNIILLLEFLERLVEVLSRYFEKVNESTIKENFAFIYELLDEMIDFGIVQMTEPHAISRALTINPVKKKESSILSMKRSTSSQNVTSHSIDHSKSVPWRRAGIRYRRNTIYLDIVERLNLLISSTGNVLRSDISGSVHMRALLSGMPECQFGISDKLDFKLKHNENRQKSSRSGNDSTASEGITLEDCQFHQCVKLPEFENERKISFIPPDGEVELMSYRSHENVHIPFRIHPIVEQLSKQKLIYRISIRSSYPHKLSTSLSLRIPVPDNVAKASPRVNRGKSGYKPSENIISWNIPNYLGDMDLILYAEVELSNTTNQQHWSRPPISLDFNIQMFASSGLKVKYLHVQEPSNSKYKSIKWVRYSTRAGTCEIRF